MAESLEQTALTIARGYFGHHAHSAHRFADGVMNYMFRIRAVDDDLCVVRIYPGSRAKVAQYEPALLTSLRSYGCTVPEVIGYDAGATGGTPHMVYRYVRGETLAVRRLQMSAAKLRALARRIVENLQAMASHRVAGFGGLITAASADDPSPWEFFSRSVSRGIDAARTTGVLDVATIDKLERLLESERAEVDAFEGTLGWGDLAFSNVIVDGNDELAGLVDFESTFAFERALSIGYLSAIAPDDPLVGILKDEASAAGFELDERRIKLCAVLRAARMTRFAHTALPSGVAQRPIVKVLPGAMAALTELTRR